MIGEELIFVATCDIAGLARGKGFPARELPLRPPRTTPTRWRLPLRIDVTRLKPEARV